MSRGLGDVYKRQIVGGTNYGQGSSREHAALVPLYLGIKAVVTKGFARIHMANLINFGIVPLTFTNSDDYDKIAQGDKIEIKSFRSDVESKEQFYLHDITNGEMISLTLTATERQRKILLAGGLLNYTKETENS